MPNIIITGGPGSGKSTLLEALSQTGHYCVPEVSRQLIREQVLNESNCLPWKDLACFASVSLGKMIFDYESASQQQTTFFDRGIPDIIAYLKVGGLQVSPLFFEAAKTFSYANPVFVAPPWKEIYVNDDERWQTFEESCALYETITLVYFDFGYQLIELPCVTVKERLEFILRYLNEEDSDTSLAEHITGFTLPSAKS